MRLGERVYDLSGRALVMGLVPVGALGAGVDVDGACRLAEQLVDSGADLLEVGGVREPADLDAGSLAAVVAALRRRVDVPLAVVARDAAVARGCFQAGAVMVRCVGGCDGADLLSAVADADAAVVVAGLERGLDLDAGGLPEDVVASLAANARLVERAGVAPDRIVLDAGLDFGTAPARSGALLRVPGGLAGLGYPVVLTVAGSSSRLAGSAAAGSGEDVSPTAAEAALGAALGCRIVRTDDVLGARRACDVIAAILGAEPHGADRPAVLGVRR